MDTWSIFLVIVIIAFIGVLTWATIKLVTKLLELLDSLKGLIDKLKTSEIIDQLGSVLRQLAELEELIKAKFGTDEKQRLEEMKRTLEEIRKKIA
jgi:TRAP-type C4-dicarboxylate transport system permease small subunit